MAIKRICDNCEKGQHGMCRYSAHPTPCPDFMIAPRLVEEQHSKEKQELRKELILRYAELLMASGNDRPHCDTIGQIARRSADSVIDELWHKENT